jgi:hypothetical protein
MNSLITTGTTPTSALAAGKVCGETDALSAPGAWTAPPNSNTSPRDGNPAREEMRTAAAEISFALPLLIGIGFILGWGLFDSMTRLLRGTATDRALVEASTTDSASTVPAQTPLASRHNYLLDN